MRGKPNQFIGVPFTGELGTSAESTSWRMNMRRQIFHSLRREEGEMRDILTDEQRR